MKTIRIDLPESLWSAYNHPNKPQKKIDFEITRSIIKINDVVTPNPYNLKGFSEYKFHIMNKGILVTFF